MKRQKGFTLVELMIVVVILGILAAIAIPAFIKYIRNSKTSEAKENLAYLFRESTTYFAGERTDAANPYTTDIDAMFPVSAPLNPLTGPTAAKQTTVWTPDLSSTWQALKFSPADPHYYAYRYDSTGTGSASNFTAYAFGDLDGDGNSSEFWRAGRVNDEMEVQGTRGLVETDPLE